MQQLRKLTLKKMKGDLKIYLNWSLNALVPVIPGAADVYLRHNKTSITRVAQMLLKEMKYIPESIYRGILLEYPVTSITPQEQLQYLSFTTDRTVAEHFANVNGFGHEILNLSLQLGTFGYIIEYTPVVAEILFHYHFLSALPYAEALSLYGMDGNREVEGLKRQKEITILQPPEPLTAITKLPYPLQ